MPIYFDCNATTPLEPIIQKEIARFFLVEYGNSGSRTHDFGTRAKKAVQKARDEIAEVVNARREDVVFTSGATESNNLAILGLAEHGKRTGCKHIIATDIEHKAVLEPLCLLSKWGFEVTLLAPNSQGWVSVEKIKESLRPETLLVSVMHANNETGVIQPISEIAELLQNHSAFFHVDAAQGFGKDISPLQNQRIDLISISSHKIYGPKGVGALITRRRGFDRVPLSPLMVGGGQERGLRPGTLPVPLIVGFGMAATLALKNVNARAAKCRLMKDKMVHAFAPLSPCFNGDQNRTLSHVLNVSFPNLDSEAIMVATKDLVAVSNGSACTSANYEPSHVLKAMGLSNQLIKGAVRFSWCHMTEEPDWKEVRKRIQVLI